MTRVSIGGLEVGNDLPLAFICGPCQIESRAHALECADAIGAMAKEAGVGMVFKSSYDKANRTSTNAARGVGMDEGLSILAEVRERTGLPVLTDVHDAAQCAPVGEAVDCLQIPAFLCRQTDLLLAAGRTGKAVNVKKGQFLAPWDMVNVAAKIASTGNEKVLLCDRGTSFGYNTLVSDLRGLPIMAHTGYPVREFAPVLARAAVAVGVAMVFIECHPDPDKAPSDGPNMIPIREMPALIARLKSFDALAKAMPAA
jgi:2-dehydro-3-deoxyphosphooctonate aldolase (KDO 8-P synthase)